MTYTERRKATIDKFINIDSIDDLREVEAGLDEFAKYILAEERERVRGVIGEELKLLSGAYAGLETLTEKSANLAIRNSFIKILSSLDKLT